MILEHWLIVILLLSHVYAFRTIGKVERTNQQLRRDIVDLMKKAAAEHNENVATIQDIQVKLRNYIEKHGTG